MQSLAETAEQRRRTIDRLTPVYEQYKDLKAECDALEA